MDAPNGTPVTGQVGAVRFSPDGTRIAVVLTTSTGTQIWIGAVSRQGSAGQAHVDSLEPISPQGIVVTDVAWNDQLRLFAIGHSVARGEASVYEVQVDGSLWVSNGISNLPQAPDSITVAENEVAWVSTGGTLWYQQAGAWSSSPNGTETRGVNPVYLE
jgi:dipeptidyl aminopeptidase/acylaminoacyl peptidase